MLLGLDLGTTNIKALVTRLDGTIVAQGSAPVGIAHGPGGTAEQDIEEIWSATLAAIRQAAQSRPLADIRAVGISSQGGAMQLLNAQSQPVGPVISWMDGRAAHWNQQITARLGNPWFRRHTGHGAGGVAGGQLARLRVQQPDVLRPPSRLGFVGDIIVSRLCGRAATDATSFSISVLFNPWLRQVDPELLAELGIDRAQLPAQLGPREIAGGITPSTAKLTGLPAGIPVSTAIHDQYAAALGCGCVHAGDMMFGAGTAWVLLAISDTLVEPVIDEAFVCTHVIDGLYGQLLSMGNGGSAVAWALETLGLKSLKRADVDAMIESIPPGCDGLRCWPLLAPNGGAKLAGNPGGRFTGLNLSHTPAHILRAAIEGLALELARYLKLLGAGGVNVSRLLMCGGAAASRITPQIIADSAALPVACVVQSDTSALGAAVIARSLIEPHASLSDLSLQMTPATRLLTPSSNSPVYHRILDEYVASLPAVLTP